MGIPLVLTSSMLPRQRKASGREFHVVTANNLSGTEICTEMKAGGPHSVSYSISEDFSFAIK